MSRRQNNKIKRGPYKQKDLSGCSTHSCISCCSQGCAPYKQKDLSGCIVLIKDVIVLIQLVSPLSACLFGKHDILDLLFMMLKHLR